MRMENVKLKKDEKNWQTEKNIYSEISPDDLQKHLTL